MAVQIDTTNSTLPPLTPVYETSESRLDHSPSSNDSGFHGDSNSTNECPPIRRHGRGITKESTYHSVFAVEKDDFYADMTHKFSKERPLFLKASLTVPQTEGVPKSPVDAPIITPKIIKSPKSPRYSSPYASGKYSENKFQFNTTENEQLRQQHLLPTRNSDLIQLDPPLISFTDEQKLVPTDESTSPIDNSAGIKLLKPESSIREITGISGTLSPISECDSCITPEPTPTAANEFDTASSGSVIEDLDTTLERKNSPTSRNDELTKKLATKVVEVPLPKLELDGAENTTEDKDWNSPKSPSSNVQNITADLPDVKTAPGFAKLEESLTEHVLNKAEDLKSCDLELQAASAKTSEGDYDKHTVTAVPITAVLESDSILASQEPFDSQHLVENSNTFNSQKLDSVDRPTSKDIYNLKTAASLASETKTVSKEVTPTRRMAAEPYPSLKTKTLNETNNNSSAFLWPTKDSSRRASETSLNSLSSSGTGASAPLSPNENIAHSGSNRLSIKEMARKFEGGGPQKPLSPSYYPTNSHLLHVSAQTRPLSSPPAYKNRRSDFITTKSSLQPQKKHSWDPSFPSSLSSVSNNDTSSNVPKFTRRSMFEGTTFSRHVEKTSPFDLQPEPINKEPLAPKIEFSQPSPTDDRIVKTEKELNEQKKNTTTISTPASPLSLISRITGDITDDKIIGRQTTPDWAGETIEDHTTSSQGAGNVNSSNSDFSFQVREPPTPEELAECKELLGSDFNNFDVYTLNVRRPSNSLDSSVGIIFTSDLRNNFIKVNKVLTGSLADRSEKIERGDRVFFINGQSTKNMDTSTARSLIRKPCEVVKIVLGHPLNTAFSYPSELLSTVTIDPATFKFSDTIDEVVLNKNTLGVGISLDGGRGSVYGDRPIVVKSIFEGTEAAKCGCLHVGDQIVRIGGTEVVGMSYVEACKVLRSGPKGPLKITFRKRL